MKGRMVGKAMLTAKQKTLPKQLQETADNLNKELINTKKTFGELLPKGDLKDFILSNLKTYMRKSFLLVVHRLP